MAFFFFFFFSFFFFALSPFLTFCLSPILVSCGLVSRYKDTPWFEEKFFACMMVKVACIVMVRVRFCTEYIQFVHIWVVWCFRIHLIPI